MKRRLFLIALIVLATTHLSRAQVREIKSNIDSDKNGASSYYSHPSEFNTSSSFSPPDFEDGIAEFLVGSFFYYTFYGAYLGLHYAQGIMQDRREYHPETFSLQGSILGGFDFANRGSTLTSSVRGNWGLFASDMRYVNTHDVTGNLNVWDWQVLILRLPIRNVKLEYGLGFTHIFDPSKTYFEQSTGIDYCFLNRKVTLQGGYRWTTETHLGERFREEMGLHIDYEIARSYYFRLSPSMGFTRQNYYASTHFNLFQVGLKIRCF